MSNNIHMSPEDTYINEDIEIRNEDKDNNLIPTCRDRWKGFHRRVCIVFHNVRMEYMHYSLKHPLKYDAYQTGILAEELAHKKPDVYFCVRALENGADPNAIIGDGLERPLHRAAKKGSPKIIEYLLQAGADINAVNARNQTALIIASDTKRVDSGYIGVIRFLCRFPGSKIEARDVGGNTPLLNAIFRNNVWVTRELLLAGAKVYRGERSPYEISLFILAHHIHLDIHEVPDKLLYPWKYSLFYYLFSPRGAYNRTIYTLFQLCTNSDIELVFKMVQHRLLDLESRGVNTDGPRDRPKEVRHTIVTTAEEEKETQDMLEKRRRQREEREARRKEEKRRKRQKSERERWENVKAGIVKSVEKEYSLEKKIRSEPDQDWVADSSSLYDDSLFPDSISIASSNRRHNSKSADNIESISESSSHSTVPGGKRWKVANKKSQVYSSNRAPGISVSVMDDYSAIGTDDTRRVTGAKRK